MYGRTLPISLIIGGTLLGGVLVLGGGYYYLYVSKKEVAITPDPSLVNAGALARTDSDQDKLLDWEETLLGTGVANPDTDNDGTSDGDEVANKRNPLIPGPNDLVASGDIATLAQEISLKEEGTLTDKAAKDLLGTYLSYKKAGVLDAKRKEELITTLVDSTEKSVHGTTYTVSDLTVSNDSPQAKKDYRKAIEQVFISRQTSIAIAGEDALVIVARALESKRDSDRAKVIELVASLNDLVDGFVKVPVPPSALQAHLGMVNSYTSYAQSIEGLRVLEADPLLALVIVSNYSKVEKDMENSARALAAYFTENQLM